MRIHRNGLINHANQSEREFNMFSFIIYYIFVNKLAYLFIQFVCNLCRQLFSANLPALHIFLDLHILLYHTAMNHNLLKIWQLTFT